MRLKTWFVMGSLCCAGVGNADPANPFPAANCGLTAETNLQGEAIALNAGDASWMMPSLSFVPKTAYVADGYALKLFSSEKFKGNSTIVGGPLYNFDLSVAGGRFSNLNTSYWSTFGNIASVACVKAGEPFTGALSTVGFTYYNDRVFGISGYRSNGLYASITSKDGKNLVTYYSGGTSRYGFDQAVIQTLDLNTGDITFRTPRATTVYHRQSPINANNLEAMAYGGAAVSMARNIAGIIPNEGNWPPQPYSVPYLELQTVVNYLNIFLPTN